MYSVRDFVFDKYKSVLGPARRGATTRPRPGPTAIANYLRRWPKDICFYGKTNRVIGCFPPLERPLSSFLSILLYITPLCCSRYTMSPLGLGRFMAAGILPIHYFASLSNKRLSRLNFGGLVEPGFIRIEFHLSWIENYSKMERSEEDYWNNLPNRVIMISSKIFISVSGRLPFKICI